MTGMEKFHKKLIETAKKQKQEKILSKSEEKQLKSFEDGCKPKIPKNRSVKSGSFKLSWNDLSKIKSLNPNNLKIIKNLYPEAISSELVKVQPIKSSNGLNSIISKYIPIFENKQTKDKSQKKARTIMKWTNETIKKVIDSLKKNKKIESVDDAIPIEKNSIIYHIKEFINTEYNQNTESLLKSITMFLSSTFITKYVKNRKLKFMINAFSFIITSGLIIFEIFMKIQHYLFNLKAEAEDMNESFHEKCVKIFSDHFNIIEDEYHDIFSTKYNPQNEKILDWLLTNPKSDVVKIEGIWDIEKKEKLTFHDLDNGLKDTGFLLRIGEYRLFWVLTTLCFQQKTRITNTTLYYYEGDDINISTINLTLSKEYVRSLNFSDNVFYFSDNNYLDIKPRCSEIKYNINQFDVKAFIDEITGILKKGGRRSYAFVGKPGVGKSQILRTIENKVTDYMIFHLSSKDFNKPNFKEILQTIKSFSPLIVIIEDLDSCNVKSKNYRVGEFINWLDESNLKNAIILTSINNTKLVNSTILRPGRTDAIIEITAPKTINEIFEVFVSKINVVKEIHNFTEELTFEYLKEFLEICLKNQYTQSEISNLVDQFFIDYVSGNDVVDILKLSIEKYENTKAARKKYYDDNEDGDDGDDGTVRNIEDDCAGG